MGMALYAPIATRNSAAYSSGPLLWTVMRMAKPAMATQMQPIAKGARFCVISESVAVSMANPNAAAQGGTECNWVWIAL